MFRLSARPIPLHRPSLEQMTAQAVKGLKDSLESRKVDDRPVSESLGDRWYRKIGVYFADNVKGKRLEIPVYLVIESKRFSSWRGYAVAGDMDLSRSRIRIKINPNVSSREYLENLRGFSKDFYSVLSHEVTHLKDVIRRENVFSSKDESKKGDYYNSPHEVRAYMRNVVDEVEEYAEEYAKGMEWFGVNRNVLNMALAASSAWSQVSKHLNASNRRKILQAAYRALKDIEPELKEKYEVRWDDDDDDDWKPTSPFQNWVEDTSESLGFKVAAGVRPYDVLAREADLPYGSDDDGFRTLAGKKSTLVWGGGLKDKTVPLSDLLSLTHGNVLRQSTEALKASILSEGFKGGAGQRLFIEVTPRGEAVLREGNHRLTALKELLREGSISKTFKVPIEIRYRGNSDLKPDSWFPRSMMKFKTAARPIRLPIRDIKRLAKDLARSLRMRGLPKPNRVVAEEYLTLSNVKGDPVDVEISLVGSPSLDFDNRNLIRGAYFKRSKPVKGLPSWASALPSKLVIYINSYIPPASFEKRPDSVVEGELYKILTHELTHAADIWSGKGSVGDLSKSLKELKRHHHNHPAEVRALMREVADEVESAVREYVEMGMGFNQSVRYALKDSKWVDIEPYLNSKSKKTILKGVHTHLHDQGLSKTAAYDPESWYFDYEKGLTLETIIDRWQKHKPRQKLYDKDQPLMISIKKIWPLREYTWTRDKARSGYAIVKGESVWLDGPLKWDAIKEDMKKRGWDKSAPLRLNIGSKGVKVGEGNHRLAIARELGIKEIPVRLIYYSGGVTKSPMPSQEPVLEADPKPIKEWLEDNPVEDEYEGSDVDTLLNLILGPRSSKKVAARYHSCQNGGPCMCGGACGGAKKAEGYKMPRKFDKRHCDSKSCDDMGFSEKASCRPYKDCYAQSKKASPIHKLAPLPFDYDALEPWIGAETVKLHHDVHQKKYVDGLNEAEKGIAICRATGDFTQLPMWNSKHSFNWGGAYLHTIYWKCLNGPVPMSRRLEAMINRDFGSVENLKAQMKAASKGIQGSGWVVLVLHRSMAGDRLSVSQVMNHDHKSLWNSVVLLPIDMWEHAYYLDYKNDKGDHLDGVLDNLINWQYVESRL